LVNLPVATTTSQQRLTVNSNSHQPADNMDLHNGDSDPKCNSSKDWCSPQCLFETFCTLPVFLYPRP
jgi:hypothetical protein